METSEQINEIATALSKAQSEIEGAVKDVRNDFFKSKYADLHGVWDACRDALVKNGLSVAQTTETPLSPFSSDKVDDGYITVVTRLMHSSGQWIQGRLRMKPVKPDPQSVGSCITYARRYALAAIVGVAQMDDDGNAASGSVQEEKKSYIKPATAAKTNYAQKDGCISEGQAKLIWARRKKANKVSDADYVKLLEEKGYKDSSFIPVGKLDEILALVE